MGKVINLKMFTKMFTRASIIWGCLFVLSGCIYNDEPMPEITYDYTQDKAVPLSRPTPAKVWKSVKGNVPRYWQPPWQAERKWTAIVIHHSGTESGNAAIFDKWHKEGNHWEGVGYDFVIGNGTDSGDGQVEVTFRWRQQRTGAHCKTPSNWANEEAVGICLVGNFNHGVPTTRQMQSLVGLVRFLQSRYRISRSRVYGHNSTPGAGATDCPGRNFSIARVRSMIGS